MTPEPAGRYIPAVIRRELRRSVAFGCPVPGCRLPFLEYHHFDPPFSEGRHHDPDGMIPLCPTHHGMADDWSADDLRRMKQDAAASPHPAAGAFEWFRRDLMIVTGGCMSIGTDTAVQVGPDPMVWFTRDELGMALLNVRMLTHRDLVDHRIRIEDGDFDVRGEPVDFACRVSGRHLRAVYDNGDALRIDLAPIETVDEAIDRYERFATSLRRSPELADRFPLAAVEVSIDIGGTTNRIARDELHWNGTTSTGGLVVDGDVTLALD